MLYNTNLLTVLISFSIVTTLATEENCTKDKTSVQDIFSRKRRLVVFPNYAAMKLVLASTKTLIATYPKGLNLAIELCLFYPFPTTLEEWYQKEKTPIIASSTTNHPLTVEMQNNLSSFIYSGDSNENNEIYFEAPSLSYKNILPASDSDWMNLKTIKTWKSPYNFSKYEDMDTKYLDGPADEKFTKWIHTPDKYERFKNYKLSHPSKWNFSKKINKEKIAPRVLNHYKNWRNYKTHRDRRELYSKFEILKEYFGWEIKACILRSICEVKLYLLPPGYSLIQDIIRILFTIPIVSRIQDEYSEAIETKQSCSQVYRKACPFSLVEAILHPDQIV